MGVRQLTTFIKDYVPDGYTDVSIVGECKKFKRKPETRRKPEIVIDTLGILRLITNFDPDKNEVNEDLAKLESLCGGSFPKYQKTCEIFFEKLSSVADLVFFEDGTVRPGKIDSNIRERNKKYHEMIEVLDKIEKGIESTEIVQNEFPRITTHLIIVEEIAAKYGKKFIITRTRECDAEIAKYANENNSFAVLAEDSDFLIFKGDWRYFSVNDLNIADLKTKEFNKRALWRTLGLKNFYQMALLATLNGNDYTSYEDLRKFNTWLINRRNSTQTESPNNFIKNTPELRFPAIAEYIRNELSNHRARQLVETIAYKAFNRDVRDCAKLKIAESIEMYHTNFPLYIPEDPIERFCIDTSNNFIYTILTNDIKKFTLLYFDLRSDEFPNLHEAETELFTKQAGIVLKHKNEDIELKMIAKRTHDGSYELRKVKPDYPPFDVPPLIELLSPEKFKIHNEVRWDLLQWSTNVGEEKSVRPLFKSIHDFITLNFMRRRGFIKIFEADLILLTIKMVRDGNYDKVYDEIPQVVNKRAFQISFMFTKFHQSISRSFRVCGLRKFCKLIDFDGVIFHNLYLKYLTPSDTPGIIELLGDLVPYRLYA